MLVRENLLPFSSNEIMAKSIVSGGKYLGAYSMAPFEGGVGETFQFSVAMKAAAPVNICVYTQLPTLQQIGFTNGPIFKVGSEYQRYTFGAEIFKGNGSSLAISFFDLDRTLTDFWVKEFVINDGVEPSEIWTPAHNELTPSQAQLMKYGNFNEIKTL